ncbi:MAG TPA: efflux RND transporter periplasmic adaptor subunit [Cytophagales bacterium]
MHNPLQEENAIRSAAQTAGPWKRLLGALALGAALAGCNAPAEENTAGTQVPALPVLTIREQPATTQQEFAGKLEGRVNVEIRPQVEGYLEKIFVEEGAFVKAGQPLFKVNDRPYREQLGNARASLDAAKAALLKAQVDVDRLTPLVQHNVVSDVQLRTAKSNQLAAQAGVAQAEAMRQAARINLGYTTITAPVSGYIGRIPRKIGSLVGKTDAEPLTLLSDIREVYAYFSMGETDFLAFTRQAPGNTIEEKLRNLPPVTLLLADNSEYPEKGRIDAVEGQFDKTTGAISFRAVFPNANGLIRSGNTGRVRLEQRREEAILVPQESTYELQEKIFVYTLADSNKVKSTAITVTGRSGTSYLVKDGVKPGDKIVFTGIGSLRDGMTITPQPVPGDSLRLGKAF